MSHMIPISNDLYMKIADYAQKSGQPIDAIVETILTTGIPNAVPAVEPSEYDPATDPLAEFIGAFDSGDLPPLEPHEHDLYFGGEEPYAKEK